MGPAMPAVRPQSYVVLAAATLALALALWWAAETFTGSGEDDEVVRRSDQPYFPEEDVPDPIEEEGEEAAPEPRDAPPVLDARPPADRPPRRIVPETVAPGMGDEEPEPAPEAGPPAPEKEEDSPSPGDHRGRTGGSSLVGGVARTSARASPEIEARRGNAWIGTPQRWIQGTMRAIGAGTYVGLAMEVPRHRVRVEHFWIDRFEVTNEQYREYLWRTSNILYRTSDHPPRTLAKIVRYLIPNRPGNLDVENVTARQLFMENRLALVNAFKDTVVKDRDGVIDLDKTYDKIRDRELPGDLDLRFFDRPPPSTWPSLVYEEGEGDHPVRDVSANEAVLYALYKGRHLPTEVQWEYAARGPNGLDYPWDPQGRGFPQAVNGGDPLPREEEPKTVPVTLFQNGSSWIGCFQMLGNVSEWTSSYLDLYPGGTGAAGVRPGANVVVRGGSARDQDRVGVRPALRGWRADDPDGAPLPNVRRLWTGFRTARFEELRKTLVPTLHFRARTGGSIDPSLLEPEQVGLFQGEQFEIFERVAGEDNREKPPPGVKSIALQPLRNVAVRPSAGGAHAANQDASIDTNVELLAASANGQPVLLGVFHTDVHLVGTWGAIGADRGPLGQPTRFRRLDTPPGTYFVAILNGLTALLRPDLRAAWYVSNRGVPKAVLNVLERRYPAGGPREPIAGLGFSEGARINIKLTVPMHATSSPGFAALLRLKLRADTRETQFVPSWEPGTTVR